MREKADELSMTEAAAILDVHRITVYHMCRSGRLPHRRRGRYLFPLIAACAALQVRKARAARLIAKASAYAQA